MYQHITLSHFATLNRAVHIVDVIVQDPLSSNAVRLIGTVPEQWNGGETDSHP